MINANELRVGNNILSIFDRVETVRMILGHQKADAYPIIYKHLIGVEENGNQYNLAEIKPIPLTPEILLACGFVEGEVCIKSSKEREKCFWLDNTFVLIRPEQNTFFGQSFISTNLKEEIWTNVIFSFHQLQNLYWCLCGKELDVKL